MLPVATACYDDFTPDVDSESVLCLNSVIVAGEEIEISVEHTRYYTSKNLNVAVSDAVVDLYVNDEYVETIKYSAEDGYISNYVPKPGDKVCLKAQSERYGRAEATVTVPPRLSASDVAVELKNVQTYDDAVDGFAYSTYISFDYSVTVDVADPMPGENNYFKVPIDEISNYTEGTDDAVLYRGSYVYDATPIFAEHIGAFDEIMGADTYCTVFSDHTFDSSTYSLTLNFKSAYYYAQANTKEDLLNIGEVDIVVATISRSYYFNELFGWASDNSVILDLGDLGLADPIHGISNVSTGAGMVSAITYNEFTADFSTHLKKYIEQ